MFRSGPYFKTKKDGEKSWASWNSLDGEELKIGMITSAFLIIFNGFHIYKDMEKNRENREKKSLSIENFTKNQY